MPMPTRLRRRKLMIFNELSKRILILKHCYIQGLWSPLLLKAIPTHFSLYLLTFLFCFPWFFISPILYFSPFRFNSPFPAHPCGLEPPVGWDPDWRKSRKFFKVHRWFVTFWWILKTILLFLRCHCVRQKITVTTCKFLKVRVPLGDFWRQFFCFCLLVCHARSVGKFMIFSLQ